jgi:hypothetical protein
LAYGFLFLALLLRTPISIPSISFGTEPSSITHGTLNLFFDRHQFHNQ